MIELHWDTRWKWVFLAVLVLAGGLVMGQKTVPAGTSKGKPTPATPVTQNRNIINTGKPTISATQDTFPAADKITIDHADILNLVREGDRELTKLLNNVELRQDSLYMYCDSAVIENEQYVWAVGKVVMHQGDSLSLYADSVYYDAQTRLAYAYGNVVLKRGQGNLFTDVLEYNTLTKVATYQQKSLIVRNETKLTSRTGYYYAETGDVYFKNKVQVDDPRFKLRADTLRFNTNSGIAYFLGPTVINNDTSKVYCEDGFYDTQFGIAEFRQHAQIKRGELTSSADTIRYESATSDYYLSGKAEVKDEKRFATANQIVYNERLDQSTLIGNAFYQEGERLVEGADTLIYESKSQRYKIRGNSTIRDGSRILQSDYVDNDPVTGTDIMQGNVVWRDTASSVELHCQTALYTQKTGYLKAYGDGKDRPWILNLMDGDSLYIAADTLLSYKPDTLAPDSVRIFKGFHDVRVYKSDLQAICDSLVYNQSDSLLTLYDQPVLWSADSTISQIMSDTMRIQLANNAIDKAYFDGNVLIIDTPDEVYFNQIKGRNAVARFREGKMDNMDVVGNAEAIYYLRDEKGAYSGLNKIVCSEMTIYFKDGELAKIALRDSPQSDLLPMQTTDHEAIRFKGFAWESQARPLGFPYLFTPKPERTRVLPAAPPSTTADQPDPVNESEKEE